MELDAARGYPTPPGIETPNAEVTTVGERIIATYKTLKGAL